SPPPELQIAVLDQSTDAGDAVDGGLLVVVERCATVDPSRVAFASSIRLAACQEHTPLFGGDGSSLLPDFVWSGPVDSPGARRGVGLTARGFESSHVHSCALPRLAASWWVRVLIDPTPASHAPL